MAKRSSSINIDLGTLKEDIRKYANNVCRYAASEIADELTESAMLSIASFYTDYTPSSYTRHYYNFMDRSYKRYYSNPHNSIYRGGVEFTPGRMSEIYRQASAEEVFGSVMELGSHGPELYTKVPPMEKSPITLIREDRDNIVKHLDEYINRARAKAKKDSYTTLRFKQ